MGFYEVYKLCTHHGGESEEANQNDIQDMHNKVYDDIDAMIRDACAPDINNRDTMGSINDDSEESHIEATKFFKLLIDLKQILYEGCDGEHTKLSFVMSMLHQQCSNKWTDKSLDG